MTTDKSIVNSEGGSSSSSSSGTILEKKLVKIVEGTALESNLETQEALKELSSFFTENSLANRRGLRGSIEKRSLQISLEFMNSLETLNASFDDLNNEITEMSMQCQKMKEELSEAKSKTQDLLNKTNLLYNKKSQLNRENAILKQFQSNFVLGESERAILTSNIGGTPQINKEFFEALNKVNGIRRDVKLLLHSGQQATAIEIMDAMSKLNESASEKVYRWARSSIISFNASDDNSNAQIMALTMSHLQDREALFKHVTDDYVATRRSALTKSFIDALTLGPRPIELHSYDPLRYIGDMLAWLHQATPSENENITALLKDCNQIDKVSVSEEILSGIADGVTKPLRTRIDQIVLQENTVLTLFKLSNLIRFYSETFKTGVIKWPESELISALDDLDKLCYVQFMNVLGANVKEAINKNEAVNQNLAPMSSTFSLLSILREILLGSSVVDQREKFDEIVAAVIIPLIKSLKSTPYLPRSDHSVYLLNSFHNIHATLTLFQFTDHYLKDLKNEMEFHLDVLSSEETSGLVANLGLQPLIAILSSNESRGETMLCQVPGMEPENLKSFMERFDSFLVAPDIFFLPQGRLLTSPIHRKKLSRRPLEVVLASYEQLYNAVNDKANGYPENLLSKSPEQVKLLLQL